MKSFVLLFKPVTTDTLLLGETITGAGTGVPFTVHVPLSSVHTKGTAFKVELVPQISPAGGITWAVTALFDIVTSSHITTVLSEFL